MQQSSKNVGQYFSNPFVSAIAILPVILLIIATQYLFPNIDILGPFIGAWFGAGVAFCLNYQHEKQRAMRENSQTLINEQYKLNSFLNELIQIENYTRKCKELALKEKDKYGVSNKEWKYLE